jgi:hypothetical protein
LRGPRVLGTEGKTMTEAANAVKSMEIEEVTAVKGSRE